MSYKIALSMRVVHAQGYNEERDALSRDWFKFLNQFDITPVLTPNLAADVLSFLNQTTIQGIILTGGNNISPQTCRFTANDEINDLALIRDNTEKMMIDYAIEKNLPIIGVCRGMQMINAYFRGSIVPNIKDRLTNGINHVAENHTIVLTQQDFVDMAGVSSVQVNSFHRHGFSENELGKGLVPFACSADGAVEGVVHKALPILGIMWHPERENPNKKLDIALIKKYLIEKITQ